MPLTDRAEWLAKITELGVRRRRILLPATRCPESLAPRSQARKLLAERRKAQGEQSPPNPFDWSDSGGCC